MFFRQRPRAYFAAQNICSKKNQKWSKMGCFFDKKRNKNEVNVKKR